MRLIYIFIFITLNLNSQTNPLKDSLDYYIKQFEKNKDTHSEVAIENIHKAQKIADKKKKIELIMDEGLLYSMNGINEVAEEKFNLALKLSQSLKNKNLEAKSYHYLAHNNYITNNLGESHKFYLKCIDLYKITNDMDNYYKALSSLSYFLSLQGKMDEAKNNYVKIIDHFKKTNQNEEVVSASINLGKLMVQIEGKEKGLSILKNLLKDYKLNFSHESKIHYNIALIYYDSNELNSSLNHFDIAIEIAEKNNLDNILIDLYTWKGEILSIKNELKIATIYYYKSLKLALKFDDLPFQENIYKSLIDNSIKLKQYDSISLWIDKLEIIRDSIAKREDVSVYNKNEMEKKIELQEMKNKKVENQLYRQISQKKFMIYIIISGIFLTILMFSSLFYYNKVTTKDLVFAKMKESDLKRLHEYEKYEKSKIKDELKAQKREMLTSLLYLRNMNIEVKKVIEKIENISEKSIITKEDLLKLKDDIINRTDVQIKMSNFNTNLVNTHRKFFTDLLQLHPNLSNIELKVLAYLRVGLTTKEIADIQNVTIEAIRKTRYRVRKKMNLDSDASLEQYLIKFQ